MYLGLPFANGGSPNPMRFTLVSTSTGCTSGDRFAYWVMFHPNATGHRRMAQQSQVVPKALVPTQSTQIRLMPLAPFDGCADWDGRRKLRSTPTLVWLWSVTRSCSRSTAEITGVLQSGKTQGKALADGELMFGSPVQFRRFTC